MSLKVVLDTNVLVSALRSRNGASFLILGMVGTGRFDIALSVPLILEYEEATKRISRSTGLLHSDIDNILDYLCRVADRRQNFYLWRPFLRDVEDDMILELAVESECDFIVTRNTRDFRGSEEFGVTAVTHREFLQKLEVIT